MGFLFLDCGTSVCCDSPRDSRFVMTLKGIRDLLSMTTPVQFPCLFCHSGFKCQGSTFTRRFRLRPPNLPTTVSAVSSFATSKLQSPHVCKQKTPQTCARGNAISNFCHFCSQLCLSSVTFFSTCFQKIVLNSLKIVLWSLCNLSQLFAA